MIRRIAERVIVATAVAGILALVGGFVFYLTDVVGDLR